MKTLGIIGGVGPESTVDYYKTIIALYRERTGDGSYPQFLINSIDLKRELDFILADDRPGLVKMIADEVTQLAKAGADFGLIASNTPHLAFDEIAAVSPIPLISIVEVTLGEAKRMGLKKLALFGSIFTMSGSFYPKVFSREKIDLIAPEPNEQEYIHDKYMNELVNGIFKDETRGRLLAIVDQMKSRAGIDSVILAGTELPLTLREPAYNGIPFLNTTKIHCQAAVAEMFK